MRMVGSESWIRVMASLAVAAAVAGTAGPAAAQPAEAVWEAASGLTPDQVCPAWTLTDTAPGADPVLANDALTLSTAAPSEDMLYLQTDLTAPLPLMCFCSTRKTQRTLPFSSRCQNGPLWTS